MSNNLTLIKMRDDLNIISNAIYKNPIDNTDIKIIDNSVISNNLNQVNTIISNIDSISPNNPYRNTIINDMINNSLDNVKTTISNSNTLISRIPGFLGMLQENVFSLINSNITADSYNRMQMNIAMSKENATTSQNMYGQRINFEGLLSYYIQILIGLQMKKLDIIKSIKNFKISNTSINIEVSLQNIINANNESDVNNIFQQLIAPVPTTTPVPTTSAPTTQIPTTSEPTTSAPTAQIPTTSAPTTQIPTTQIPTTQIPTTPKVPLISENYTFITSLKVPASKGETKIYVEDDSKFKIGDSIQIGTYDITIAKVIGFGSLILDTPLKFNYSGNVPVAIMKNAENSNNSTIHIIILIVFCIILLLLYYFFIISLFTKHKIKN
jgi:hypothetical protein